MLCITVKLGDGFIIGPGIAIRLQEKRDGNQIKVVIIAPKELGISRLNGAELHDRFTKSRPSQEPATA